MKRELIRSFSEWFDWFALEVGNLCGVPEVPYRETFEEYVGTYAGGARQQYFNYAEMRVTPNQALNIYTYDSYGNSQACRLGYLASFTLQFSWSSGRPIDATGPDGEWICRIANPELMLPVGMKTACGIYFSGGPVYTYNKKVFVWLVGKQDYTELRVRAETPIQSGMTCIVGGTWVVDKDNARP